MKVQKSIPVTLLVVSVALIPLWFATGGPMTDDPAILCVSLWAGLLALWSRYLHEKYTEGV